MTTAMARNNHHPLIRILPECTHSTWARNAVLAAISARYLEEHQGYHSVYESHSICIDKFNRQFLGKISVHNFIKNDGTMGVRVITVQDSNCDGSVPAHQNETTCPSDPPKII